MNKLDILRFPLCGQSLIEASAGTGKTFTITHLYIRLLLGHGCDPLTVEQILLVTFTNAATAELKQRIRDRINQTWREFYAGDSEDEHTRQLLNEIEDRELACERLALASKQMDEGAIFTIHGFCQRMLLEHAFESGMEYEQSLILDESELLLQAAEDFWRMRVSPLSLPELSLLMKHWSSPGAFARNIQPLLSREVRQIEVTKDWQACVNDYVSQVQSVKRWWLSNEVGSRLLAADLNGRSVISKPVCHQAMDQFSRGDGLEFVYNRQGWGLFTPASVSKASKKNSKDISDLDFSRFELLIEAQQKAELAVVSHFTQVAREEISARLRYAKAEQGVLSADDLLSQLQSALVEEGGDGLAQAIRQAYPTALIDEFQDTDPSQYQIFSRIYQQDSTLVMIGDPKQAIYGFRGADIFTYIEAKQGVTPEQRFTMSTNWRSQPKLVESINQLFVASPHGFMFEQDIPFSSVEAAKTNQGFTLNGDPVVSMSFQRLISPQGKPLSWSSSQQALADHTAGQIGYWLHQAAKQQALIKGKPLKAGDCCVLVRDRNEADLIKQALARLNIASVFLVRKSVFSTDIAYQLGLLLQALYQPVNERKIRAALLSELFTLSSHEFEALLADELGWQQLMEQFTIWKSLWQRKGVMTALSALLDHFEVYSRQIRSFSDGKRRVTDLRHLLELLQQQSAIQQGEAQLLRWYQQGLAEPDHSHEGQQMRLETDEQLVQIVTVHGSKGLEYPLVFYPFPCRFKAQSQAVFHDESKQLVVDLSAQEAHVEKAERERLAEDIRLFYVALTRGIYYCSLGIWNNGGGRGKPSELTKTALGSLLFSPETEVDESVIQSALEEFGASSDSDWLEVGCFDDVPPLPHTQTEQNNFSVKGFEGEISKIWRITSYSALSQHHGAISERPGYDEGHSDVNIVSEHDSEALDVLDPFHFVKGAKAGSFLHGVLENCGFQTPPELPEVIRQQGQWFGIDEKWFPCTEQWIHQIHKWPLNDNGLSLSVLKPGQYKVEMEFFLPLQHVCMSEFRQILNRHLTHAMAPWSFSQLHGMLKGFIDLTFEHDGRFYIADYKSNHLGYHYGDYNRAQMNQAMADHDYMLQAVLYTLALHRWLKESLQGYQYAKHIGGAYYLFLRGMQGMPNCEQGVFFTLPSEELIVALDSLFDGQTLAQSDNTNSGEQLSLW